MATSATTPTIGRLLALTTVTCLCAAFIGAASASDQASSPLVKAIGTAESRPQNGILSPADRVAEERWARPADDYVLAEGGQVVPQREALTIIGVPGDSTTGPKTNDNLFGGDDLLGVPECARSPLTPEEITRLVIAAAQRHKVDVGFAVAVVTAESRLDRLRNSPKGARGPMQLMPKTAERFGVADICDPEANIDGGVRYLRALTDEFRNPLLVAAAYNAGEGSVREHGGIPPFRETLGYVAEILNIQMGINGGSAPKQRGATDTPAPPSDVTGVITLRERRQWLGGVMQF